MTHVRPTGILHANTSAATAAQTGPVPAGFWRRAWARFITTLIWTAIVGLGTFGITAATLALFDIARSDAITVGGLIIAWVFGLLISYLVFSRSLATHRGTIGMRQMGLGIIDTRTGSRLSRQRAFRRSLLPLAPFAVWSSASWIVLFNPSPSVASIFALVAGAITLLTVLGGLWMLVSASRQTMWDLVGGTLVVVERPPSWMAVVGLLAGLMVPLTAVVSLAVVGTERLQAEYDRLSGLDAAVRYLVYSVPALLVSLVAIVVGHLAARATGRFAGGRAGSGLVRTGLAFGYAFPIAMVVVVGFGLLNSRLEERESRSCAEQRILLADAVDSYVRLNGALPESVGALATGPYLGDADLSETWKVTPSSSAPGGYRLEGSADCSSA